MLRSCCSLVILLITAPIVLFYVLVAIDFVGSYLMCEKKKIPWKFAYLHRAKSGLKSGSKNGFSNGFSISSLKFLQDQLAVSDGTIFVVYKMLVICIFCSFGRQIKCGAAKKNVLSIRFLWAKSRSNSRSLRHTPQTRTRWSITQESRPYF